MIWIKDSFRKINSGKSFLQNLRFTTLVLSCFALVLFSGCTQNPSNFGPQSGDGNPPIPVKERTIILNEGNFMFGNGSISILKNLTGTVTQGAFKSANGVPLGDVPQSLLIHDSLAYIIVNNSGKIEVVDKSDFTSVKTITGFSSPRHMAIVSDDPLIAWVTDLYANKIWEVYIDHGVISRSFTLDGWNENILIHNSDAFILNKTDSVIHVLDVASATKKYTYNIGGGVVDFKKWSKNELMVLAIDGVYLLDMNQSKVDTILTFPVQRNPSKMAVDTTENRVYFLESEVYTLDVTQTNLTVELFVAKTGGVNWYGLDVNSQNGYVYVTDAKDYVQKGELNIFDISGNQVGLFIMGINPQFILFD